MWGSFKVKLVSRFLALSLLALATAYWSFSTVADRTVTKGVDGRLEAGLRAAVAAFDDERSEADAAAVRLARTPSFQRALARRDRAALERLLRATRPLRLEDSGGLVVGPRGPLLANTRVELVGARPAAALVTGVQLGRPLLRRL